MNRTLSAAQAKAHFSDCLRKAEQGRHFVITRWGRPVAALVPAARLRQIERLLAAGPEAGLAGMAGKWSEEFVALLSRHRRTPPRPLPKLDE